MKNGFKIADLIEKLKYSFRFIIKLIANKFYTDLFFYLSFLLLGIRFLFFTIQTLDLLFILDYFLGSISNEYY